MLQVNVNGDVLIFRHFGGSHNLDLLNFYLFILRLHKVLHGQVSVQSCT
jgi:hypothetical protein